MIPAPAGPLSIPNFVQGGGLVNLSLSLDLVSFDMTGDATAQLIGGVDGDAVSLYGSDLPIVTSLAQLFGIGAIGGITGGNTTSTSGQGPITVRSPLYRYLYALRTAGATHGLTMTVYGSEPNSGGGGGGVSAVSGVAPIISSGGATPAISIAPATDLLPGSLSAADKTKLDSIEAGASVASVTAGTNITVTGTAQNPIINATTPGGPALDYFFSWTITPVTDIAVDAPFTFGATGGGAAGSGDQFSGATITKTGPGTYMLAPGTYMVDFQGSFTQAAQAVALLNGVILPQTEIGNSTGTTQLNGAWVVTVPGLVPLSFEVHNHSSASALTLTVLAGGPVAQAMTIRIMKIG